MSALFHTNAPAVCQSPPLSPEMPPSPPRDLAGKTAFSLPVAVFRRVWYDGENPQRRRENRPFPPAERAGGGKGGAERRRHLRRGKESMGKPHTKGRRPRRRAPKNAGLGGLGLIFLLAVCIIAYNRLGPQESAQAPDAVSSVALPEGDTTLEDGLQVYFLDVGQGDSELIRIPAEGDYFNVLLDTGEYEYADGLTDYLRDLGVERIDALICSHPHTDHMGCMARIVQRFDIGSIYMPLVPEDQTPTTSAYEALLDRVLEKNLVITQLCAGTVIDCPAGAEFQVVAPQKEDVWEEMNDYSAVIRLVYGETTFLFPGDAEADSEEEILDAGYEVSADVLKVGHHGSSTSTSEPFLEAVNPRWAVISCGEDNRYGHPHRETRQLLGDWPGLTTYRTDQDGTILARSDGETIRFETGLPSVEGRSDWD